MRENEFTIPDPPDNDRPNDQWLGESDQQPSLTWFGRRRRWYWGGGVGALVLSVCSIWFIPSAVLFKPGELSSPHAQILAGSVGSERCAACHDSESLNVTAWFSSASETPGHKGVKQSDRCLNCHHRTINTNLARAAHNLPKSVRDELTESFRLAAADKFRSGEGPGFQLSQLVSTGTSIDQDDIECSVCHREHHGADGHLLAVTDNQCQTCHAVQFGQFDRSHPQWGQWPYGRGGSIAFSHASHQNKHFPGWQNGSLRFDCNRCHPDRKVVAGLQTNRRGELLRTVAFETGCAACHESSMQTTIGPGIELLAVPSITTETAARQKNWPESATGFIDGRISPLMELLLRSDKQAAESLHQIPDGELSSLNPENIKSEAISKSVAEATVRLIDEISQQGHLAIKNRLATAGTINHPLGSVLRTLPPQLIIDARREWFKPKAASADIKEALRLQSQVRQVVADDDDLLSEDSSLLNSDSLLLESSDDELLIDPLASSPSDDPLIEHTEPELTPLNVSPEFDAGTMAGEGGWYRDDLRLAIRYRASGHTDPVLKGLIEMFSGLSDADPLKERFMNVPAVKACVDCHSGATRLPASWEAIPSVGGKRDFTKFSHRPHLNVSQLGQCTYCHKVSEGHGDVEGEHDPSLVDFEPLERQTCAACHTKNAASDSCTTCHRYHIEH
ncbi:cytochrome c family protein [Stieleria sp. JC731]|uniref:cytochrome c3 family protein n=1 Tax=Pirellulaceae TaxID=2691357 RepID=UPI001E2B9807|nr:cytochrome c3 family protein [Stieleria sp. JC731]MCC9603025.1 cytochrome c family protein [Stieleria sp. JC731]